jgi:hypothetical protein
VLITYRADLHTSATCSARPEYVGVDDDLITHIGITTREPQRRVLLKVDLLATRLKAVLHVVLEVYDHVHGLEGLTAEVGGAVVVTAPTLGAAETVKELLPA